jgi:hypothetical protein
LSGHALAGLCAVLRENKFDTRRSSRGNAHRI